MSNHPRTALAVVEHALKSYPERPAFTCLGCTVSYRQVDEQSAAFAAYLVNELGMKPGDRIALQMPNIVQFPIALYGAIRAGLVIVNVNPLYTKRELKHQLNDSNAKVIVVLSNVAEALAGVISETSIEQVVITDIGDFMPWLKAKVVNFACKYVKKLVPNVGFPESVSFLEALKLGKRYAAPSVVRQPDDLLVLQYTGGTTGLSKGAMLSNSNLMENVRQIKTHLPEFFSEEAEIFAAPLPLYHIYALNLHLMAGFSNGAHSILIPNPRDLPSLFDALKPFSPTVFVGINTLFNAMLKHPRFQEIDFSKLKVTAAGGMALTTETAHAWEEATHCKISEGYGLTETSPVVSTNALSAIKAGTIGTPLPDTEVKVIDENGNALPVNEPGELCVKGPQVMQGYWQNPEATAQVLTADGWFKTGDIAVIRDDGYLKIVDRKKDMIIVSGFNVYPNEVEDVAMMHPNIIEAAVIGVPMSQGGEQVKIFVVSDSEKLSEEDVIAHCRENLTPYKVPKLVEFRDSLPKTNVGKILRRELRG